LNGEETCRLCDVKVTVKYSNETRVKNLREFTSYDGEYICKGCLERIRDKFFQVVTIPKKPRNPIKTIIRFKNWLWWKEGEYQDND